MFVNAIEVEICGSDCKKKIIVRKISKDLIVKFPNISGQKNKTPKVKRVNKRHYETSPN